MNVFLEEFSKQLGEDKVLLVMDQAGWHHSQKLKIPHNIEIFLLSPYSPELNPVERLWQELKDKIIKNKVYATIKELEQAVCSFVQTITPQLITSICSVNYMSYYL